MTRNELDRIYMLADAFNNNYKPVVHPSYQTANNTLIMYQYIRLLPLATLSSLSEPLVVFERSGTDTRKGIARALLNASKVAIKGWDKALKDMPHNEALQWMVEAGIALDHAATERIAATYGGNAEAVKGTIKIPFTDKEVKTDVITGKFFKYNLLGPFTRFNRMFAFQSALNMVKSHAERLATEQAPVGSRRYVRWVQELKELGLNPIEAVQWYQRGASRADPYAPQVTLAAMRFTNEVVMHPRPNNRPFWQSNPHFALISQLKGFQTVFGNTVVKRWIKKIFGSDIYSGMRNGYQIAGVAILMTSIAMLANMIRERAVWYPEEGNPSWKNSSAEEVLYRAASRAGIFGGAQFALDMLNAHTFGASPLDPVLGPTVSQGVELFEGLASATIGDSSKKLQTEVMKAFPFMTNISPGLRQAMKEEIEQIRL